MALRLPHQLGSLAGAPIKSRETTASSPNSSLSVSPPLARVHKAMNLNHNSRGMNPVVADLSVRCKAFAVERRTHKEGRVGGGGGGVPVFVMMPLDSVRMGNAVNRRKAMRASLQALRSGGVEGIMIDVWWGLVERESPGGYNWGGYDEVLEMARKVGLKVQAVMSFHQCGGNVGDSVTYVPSLP